MVDLRGLVGALWKFLIRAVQSVLAAGVLLSLRLLQEVPSGPNAPEQAGTFVWAFLFSWGFATAVLLIILVCHILFNSYRTWSAGNGSKLRSSAVRIGAESTLGLLITGIQVTSSETSLVLAAPAVAAWTVLIHHGIGVIQFSRGAVQAK